MSDGLQFNTFLNIGGLCLIDTAVLVEYRPIKLVRNYDNYKRISLGSCHSEKVAGGVE